MIAFTALPVVLQALIVVIAVAVEAVLLYAGYGYLEELVGSRVITTIENV